MLSDLDSAILKSLGYPFYFLFYFIIPFNDVGMVSNKISKWKLTKVLVMTKNIHILMLLNIVMELNNVLVNRFNIRTLFT